MARTVFEETTIRRVRRNGVTYMFQKDYEPAVDGFGGRHPDLIFPSRTELTALRWAGSYWVHLHHIVIMGNEDNPKD